MKLSLITAVLCLALSATVQADDQLQLIIRQLDQLQKQVDAQEEKQRECSSQGKVMTNQIDVAVKELIDVKQLLNVAVHERRELREHLDGAVQELQIVRKERSELKEQLERIEGHNYNTADLEERVSGLEGSLSTVEHNVVIMESKMVLTSSQIENLRTEMNDVEDDVQSVKHRMDQIEKDDMINTRLDSIESDLATQEEVNAKHDQLIEDVQTNLQELHAESKRTDQVVQGKLQELEGAGERYSFLVDLTSDHMTGDDVIVFNRVHYNHGEVYDPTFGFWKAPVDAVYQFTASLEVYGGKSLIRWYVDSVSVTYSWSLDPANYYHHAAQTVQLQLTAGQRVTVKMTSANYVHGDADNELESYLSGHLVQMSQ